MSWWKEKFLSYFKSKISLLKNLDKTPTPKPTINTVSGLAIFDTPKATKAETKYISPVKLHEEFSNEIENEEKILTMKYLRIILGIIIRYFLQKIHETIKVKKMLMIPWLIYKTLLIKKNS